MTPHQKGEVKSSGMEMKLEDDFSGKSSDVLI